MTIIKEFSWCKEYGIDHVRINIEWNWNTIWYSYKIKKIKHMREVIEWMKTYNDNEKLLAIPNWFIIAEWRTHNLLYWLNYERTRTRHLDINADYPLLHKIGYVVGSLFYWGF